MLTHWQLGVSRTLLHHDADSLVGQLGHDVRRSLIDSNAVPVKRNNIQIWEHGAATWSSESIYGEKLKAEEQSIHYTHCYIASQGQSHLGQHLSPLMRTAKPSRPQFGGCDVKGQL